MKKTLLLLILMGSLKLSGAPFNGTVMQFRQPDGSVVDVKLYGTEFYMRAEGLDGYTLIRDKATGWICYADLSVDGTVLVSTGTRYKGQKSDGSGRQTVTGLTRHTDISEEARNRIILQNKQQLLGDSFSKADKTDPYTVSGNIKGLCIVVDFSDELGTLPLSEFENFCNDLNYSNFGNNGSLRKYYSDISGGLVDYENIVFGYYRAPHTFAYYEGLQMTVGAQQILGLALNWIESQGFDFSTLSTNPDGSIIAINLMYTGVAQTWSEGMWWHQGYYDGFSADGVQSGAYNCSPAYSPLTIATVCHENGHMLGHWPDTYKYNNTTGPDGIGAFDLMCWYGDEYNPVPPNPHFWSNAGWGEVVDVTFFNGLISDTANSLTCFRYKNLNDTNEFFLLENRVRSGRSVSIPDEGLTIWHIDRKGSNQSTHHEVFLEHAGNNIEVHTTACFHAGINSEFSNTTLPGSQFYNSDPSGLRVWEIGARSDVMTYKLGAGEPAPTFYLSFRGISDDNTGDGFLEPGESGNANIEAGNFGQLSSDSAIITCTAIGLNAGLVAVNDAEILLDTLAISEIIDVAFAITISQDAQVGDVIELMFQISDGSYSTYITNNIALGRQVIMANGELTLCSGLFLDSGGALLNYNDREDHTITMYPAVEGHRIQAVFTEIGLEEEANCIFDNLSIYDGPSTSSVRIGIYCGTNSPGTIISSHSTGALTFDFHSDEYVTASGWSAVISCTDAVGLNDPANETLLTIHPNPLTDRSWIDLTNQAYENLQVLILDISGSPVMKFTNYNMQAIELNKANFVPGIYYVQLLDGRQVLETRKLVVF